MIGLARWPAPLRAINTPRHTPNSCSSGLQADVCSRRGVLAVRAKTLTPGRSELQNLVGASCRCAEAARKAAAIRRFFGASESPARTI